jgi:hypothetical protein
MCYTNTRHIRKNPKSQKLWWILFERPSDRWHKKSYRVANFLFFFHQSTQNILCAYSVSFMIYINLLICKFSFNLLHIWNSYGKFWFGGHLEFLRHLGFTRCLIGRFLKLMYLSTQNSLVFENRWRFDWDRMQSVKR